MLLQTWVSVLAVAVVACAAVVEQAEARTLFNAFVVQHGKTYHSDAETEHRFGVFKEVRLI